MACRQETLEINGDTYLVFQLPPSEALPLKFKLAKILGPSLAELLEGIDIAGDNQKASGKAVIEAISKIFSELDPEEITKLIQKVVSRVRKNGKHVIFDEDFQDDFNTLYKIFFWVLQVNFGNFFEGLGLKAGLEKLVRA